MTVSMRTIQSALGIMLAGILFVAVVLLVDRQLRGMRIDLTAENLYSISNDTRRILDRIDDPVTLTFYFSYEAAEGVPYVREYARRVEELLEAYVARSNGRIRLRTVDPRRLTEARERADELGLQPIPAGDGKEIYLGLVGTNRLDGLETIEFFEPERERFLEYDVSRLVWALSNPDRPKVGLLSRLPMTQRVDPGTGRQHPNWAVIDRLEEVVDLEELQHPLHEIGDDIDVLMVSHPHGYDAATLYAIDQYLMRGGRVILFADPVADSASGQRERDGEVETRISSSDPGPLLSGWGIDLDLDQALADPRSGMVVSASTGGGRDVHPGLMRIEGDGMAGEDPVTAMIEQVVVGSPGSIDVPDDGPQMRPLLRTSPTAAPVPIEHFVGFERPWDIIRGYQPDDERHVVAARFEGSVASAYPAGRPDDSAADPDAHRQATESAHLLLFADTDLLTDQLWVRPQRGDGGRVRSAFAGNGDVVVNAVENLAGSDALINLRARGTSARPFTRVQELEREAAERYRGRQRELRTELEETEERIESLRAGETAESGNAILSDEEREQLAQARERRRELRAELRTVEQQLEARVDALGTRLKFLNIVAVPLLITLAALVTFSLRRRRRRRIAG